MIKKCFLFHLKSSFFLKYLSLCLYILVLYKNGLFRKIRLISKLMTSQPDKQTILIHIFPNISRRKCNQTMKLGQLIKYNMRNTFVEKSYTKCGGETILRPFSKKSKLSYLCINSPKVLYSLFLLYANLRSIELY